MKTTNKNIFEQSFDGQRLYRAKNDAYEFDIFSDTWQLGTKNFIHLDWMHNLNYDQQTFIDLHVLLAKAATMQSPHTVRIYADALKQLGNRLAIAEFKLAWLLWTESKQKRLSDLFRFAIDKANLPQFKALDDYAVAHRPKNKLGSNILDPEKGAYSEIEYDSIKEQLRLATINLQKKCANAQDVHSLSILIGFQLMIAFVRRPTQLVQLKWSDVLPVGESFSNHRAFKTESAPKIDYSFTDIECLQVRTFKGKDGQFRSNAETRPQRLEPDLSSLLLFYRQQYESVFINHLANQEIHLTPEECHEIMLRCPIIPEYQLFTMDFETKSNLFQVLGHLSDAFHKTNQNLRAHFQWFHETTLNLKSDRIEDSKLKVGNNRIRHTVLTSGARQGLTAPELAAISGGSQQSVKSYIELDFDSRLKIDLAFVEKDVLRRFGNMSVKDVQKQDGFVVRNEFDEEIGIQANPANCASCSSKMGAPLGCYPCDNFTAIDEANHQQYLDKALRKLELNERESNPVVLKKLKKIILYIQATIKICEERKLAARGLPHDAN